MVGIPAETCLTVLVHDFEPSPPLLGLCAGYEDGSWRADALARSLLGWITDWALSYADRQALADEPPFNALARAVQKVYMSTKPERRGEIGELLLHMAIRSVYFTEPAISKIFFKDSSNDTVKGFDAVHVVPDRQTGDLELWLGESKFYTSLTEAIRDVLMELEEHLATPYLRLEFAAVADKIDATWPHAKQLRELLRQELSLDQVFDRVVVPILLTYESPAVARHSQFSTLYRAEIETELRKGWASFCRRLGKGPKPREISIRLILVPMQEKRRLVDSFDERLKALQAGLS
jgi:hypothetical protein